MIKSKNSVRAAALALGLLFAAGVGASMVATADSTISANKVVQREVKREVVKR